ncbi:MAG: group II intron maturase-specific domain-containing protein [Candidatus Brocadiia bacterium]
MQMVRKMVRIKFPRAKSMKKARAGIKERVKNIPLGEPLKEAIGALNRKLRGWANYFRIGNSYEAARELTAFACQQLRLYLRRRRARKDIVGYRRWPNGFLHEEGLEYVPHLL